MPPALIGSLLAYLIANGVAMRDVRISSLKAAVSEIPAREPAFIQAAPAVAPAPPSEKAPFPEERYIRARANPGERFRDFILRIRG